MPAVPLAQLRRRRQLRLDLLDRRAAGGRDVDAQPADALGMQGVELGRGHLRRQHRDAACIAVLRDAVERAGVIGAVEARLHDHDARHAEPLEHGGKLAGGRVGRRIAAGSRAAESAASGRSHAHGSRRNWVAETSSGR